MWKVIAIICILEWPDYTMNSELQCTQFDDTESSYFFEYKDCDSFAEQRFYQTMDQFNKNNVDFESIQVGCVSEEWNS